MYNKNDFSGILLSFIIYSGKMRFYLIKYLYSSKAKVVGADNYLHLIKEKIILSINARYQALYFVFLIFILYWNIVD